MLNGLGIETGIDLEKLVDADASISHMRRPPHRCRVWPVWRALQAKGAG